MQHYPYGKLFEFEYDEFERFKNKDISITGLLSGKKTKKALELVKAYDDFEKILKVVGYVPDWDWKEIEAFFLNPPVTDEYDIVFKEPDEEKILKFLVDEHDFSEERVRKAVDRLKEVTPAKGTQSSLEAWFG